MQNKMTVMIVPLVGSSLIDGINPWVAVNGNNAWFVSEVTPLFRLTHEYYIRPII
jgi:Na+/glutamate symporter